MITDSFTISYLRDRTGDLVRNADGGRLSVLGKHVYPLFVVVPLSDHLLENGVGVALACRQFAEKAMSLGKGAKLVGLTPEAFFEQLGAMNIPAVDYPAEEVGILKS